jgi:dolichol-phosphate mannosyltransferase|tara:strand:+ start:1211 stop:2281 length:1071 start_codon:yes stop_codon:yes gene_type:complete
MAGNKCLLSVVIPCCNEEEVIDETNKRFLDVLGNEEDFDLQIIYINDGSSDRTSELLNSFVEKDPRVAVVEFTRNFGHQTAITAGIDYAAGDMIAVTDADLQDPPEIILKMIELWRDGFDVVYGVRRNRRENISKRAAYATFYIFLKWLSKIDIPLDSGDFCLIDRKVADALRALPEKNRFVRGLRAWVGLRQTSMPYDRHERAGGKSKYTLSKLFVLAFDGIINFSTKPLILLSVFGLLLSFGSLLSSVLVGIWRLLDVHVFGFSPSDVPGYASVVLLILFFSGIQLLSLGIIGEYIGRIHEEIKRRPIYIVAHSAGFGEHGVGGESSGQGGAVGPTRGLDLSRYSHERSKFAKS